MLSPCYLGVLRVGSVHLRDDNVFAPYKLFFPLFPNFSHFSPLFPTFSHLFPLFPTFHHFSPLFTTFPDRAAPETIGLHLPRTGPLLEKLNHTIQAPPGGVKSTEPGSARSIVNYTIRASPGGVESHHTGSSWRSQVHRTGLYPIYC